MNDRANSSEQEGTTYYGLPVIKEPVWTWEVPAYFYVGGAAGAAATIGATLQVLDGDNSELLVRRCRDIAAAGTLAGSALLISDLGRPERFLNMLRVFKPALAAKSRLLDPRHRYRAVRRCGGVVSLAWIPAQARRACRTWGGGNRTPPVGLHRGTTGRHGRPGVEGKSSKHAPAVRGIRYGGGLLPSGNG